MDNKLITKCLNSSLRVQFSAPLDQKAKIKSLWVMLANFTWLLLTFLFTLLFYLMINPQVTQAAEGVARNTNFESTIILTAHCELTMEVTQVAELIKLYKRPGQSLGYALKWVRCEGYNSGPSEVIDYSSVDPQFMRESADLQYKAVEASYKNTRAIKVVPYGTISLSTSGNVEDCKYNTCAGTANYRELMITF